jgi:hypothetical protein
MGRLTGEAWRAAAAGRVATLNRDAGHSKMDEALRLTQDVILPNLAPLFPNVARATQDEDSAIAWCHSWAKQLVAHSLIEPEVQAGLGAIASVVQSHGSPPLSFSHFLQACRPNAQKIGSDLEAHTPFPLMLGRDRLKDEGWCRARDLALSKIRAMGYLQVKNKVG